MNIIFDLRLFSYNYNSRGVGNYTLKVCVRLIDILAEKNRLLFLGERKKIPQKLLSKCHTLIEYRDNTWKDSIIKIPFYVLKYKADRFIYWMALGPVSNMGLSFLPFCKTVSVVYDLSVEDWHEHKFAKSRRRTKYWFFQKLLVKLTNIVTISEATAERVKLVIGKNSKLVVYPPYKNNFQETNFIRKKEFILLFGTYNKNVDRTICAFKKFHEKNPEYRLIVLDSSFESTEKNELGAIVYDNMEYYNKYISTASALLFFSTNEGLGLPVIEAISFGTPVLMSDIPSLHEIFSIPNGLFANPHDEDIMSALMETVVKDISKYSIMSKKAFIKYSNTAEKSVLDLASLILSSSAKNR